MHQRRHGTIALVDPDGMRRELIARGLRRAGYEVLTAADEGEVVGREVDLLFQTPTGVASSPQAARPVVDRLRARALLARTDRASGLPNRAMVLERLERALGRACGRDTRVALFDIDVAWPEALSEPIRARLQGVIARRLVAALPRGTHVGSLHPGRFAVVLEGLADAAAGLAAAGRILACFFEPVEDAAGSFELVPAVGVALGQMGMRPVSMTERAAASMARAHLAGNAHELGASLAGCEPARRAA